MQFLAKVYVTLKPAVNDPQGITVQSALKTLGFQSVGSVRVGKYLEVMLEAADKASAEAQATEMCKKLLANPVIEQFRLDVAEVAVAAKL
ncbi:MAG: phosphoribosylformylglycinamidine synthase subunit PurS [Dehalococcoidia bacterium]|nr:phosphoribosylformylglycinamidine synthase subunit PurS [Dehalococcoidia bacterium]